MIFRALWPVVDETRPFFDLCDEAWADAPLLLRQAHARPTAPGRFYVADSRGVPGSGRTTRWVLLFECPALHVPRQRLTAAHIHAALTPSPSSTTNHQENAA